MAVEAEAAEDVGEATEAAPPPTPAEAEEEALWRGEDIIYEFWNGTVPHMAVKADTWLKTGKT